MGNVSKEWASLAVLKTILKLSEMCAESKGNEPGLNIVDRLRPCC